MCRKIILVVAVLAGTQQLRAQADQPSTWPVGSRVRLSTLSTQKVVGELSEVRGDTLVLRTGNGLINFRRTIHADSLLSLEISSDRYVSWRRVAFGAVAGAIGGVLLTRVLNWGDVCLPGACSEPEFARDAIIGGVAGAVTGALQRKDRWREAPRPARVLIAPSAGRTTIGISLTIR